jgi:tetratricopeptide (TPR) repeat protein
VTSAPGAKIDMLTKGFAVALALCLIVPASADARPKRSSGPHLIRGLGEAHHAVSTKNKEAQKFFDQGLALLYGFNHDAARRCFEHAAKLDPELAMAWWGVAMSVGPNYNFPADAEREKAGYDAIQRALALQDKASESEGAYINALAFRHSHDAKADLHQLDVAYRDAMSKLVTRYPDDLDGATLYADSAMNLHRWELWLRDGSPNEGTEEIVAVLESVLRRDPNHLGANHFYIHVIEASPHPERGLPSAARLEKLAPAAGHLLHMPSHIYARLGDYTGSARCNEMAVAADKRFFAKAHPPDIYAFMLSSHNLHFLAYAACMNENFAEARNAAARLAANVAPAVKTMPMLQGFLSTPIVVLLAFERWDDIIRLPAPDASLLIPQAAWHFARAMADASLGKTAAAEQEQSAWQSIVAKIPPDTLVDEVNKIGPVFKIQGSLLSSAIARSRHDDKATIDFLNQAVAAEDALNYSEPPAFYPPVRPLLGRVFLEMKQWPEAEKVFRADLDRNPRNGRALAGLRDCLEAQKRFYEATQIDQQLRQAQGKIDQGPRARTRK